MFLSSSTFIFISNQYTAWKFSLFGVFLVRIFADLDWIRNRKTPNTDTFYAVKPATYLLVKYLNPILHSHTINEYTVKNYFGFAEVVAKYYFNWLVLMLSCYLLTPLWKKLLGTVSIESSFIFENKFYKQIDGVAMGSPLGPTLANAFLCSYVKIGLMNAFPNLNLLFTDVILTTFGRHYCSV